MKKLNKIILNLPWIISNFKRFSALQTSVPEKLYAAFQREAPEGVNISETMGSWVTQPGYPVIFVNVSEDRKSAELSQRKFLRNSHGHNDNTLWSVPITYATNNYTYFNRTQPVVYLSSDKVQIDIGEANEWIILNVQQTGQCKCCQLLMFSPLVRLLEWNVVISKSNALLCNTILLIIQQHDMKCNQTPIRD